MTPYNHDMSEETPPKQLLEKGVRVFKIQSCVEETSKQGNQMFVMGFLDKETQYVDKIYAVAEKGKRWFLKSVLEACGADSSNWEIADILDKEVEGLVTHEPNKYINRAGEDVETTQHRITDIKPHSWDE